jgi:hypothetical protein
MRGRKLKWLWRQDAADSMGLQSQEQNRRLATQAGYGDCSPLISDSDCYQRVYLVAG